VGALSARISPSGFNFVVSQPRRRPCEVRHLRLQCHPLHAKPRFFSGPNPECVGCRGEQTLTLPAVAVGLPLEFKLTARNAPGNLACGLEMALTHSVCSSREDHVGHESRTAERVRLRSSTTACFVQVAPSVEVAFPIRSVPSASTRSCGCSRKLDAASESDVDTVPSSELEA